MKRILKSEKFILVGNSKKGYLSKAEARGCLSTGGVEELNSHKNIDLSEGRTTRGADYVYELARFSHRLMCIQDLESDLADFGHTVTPVYNLESDYTMSQATKKNWKQSQCYFVDLDDVEYDLDYIWSHLPADKLPTFGYYSFGEAEYRESKITDKHRIRLVYVFSEPTTDHNEFVLRSKEIHNFVADTLGITIKDDCGTDYNQIFYGSTVGTSRCSQNVYDFEDFPIDSTMLFLTNHSGNISFESFSSEVPPTNSANDKNNIAEYKEDLIKAIGRLWKEPSKHNLKCYLREFESKYGWRWFTSSAWEWPENEYVERPTWFYKISWNFSGEYKINNHRGRKRVLAQWAIIRRAINPEVTGDELLFCMAYDMFMYTDFMDNNTKEHQRISINDLVFRINSVMSMSMEEVYAEANKVQHRYIINPTKPLAEKRKIAGRIKSNNANAAKDAVFGDIYYDGITPDEICEIANDQYGFKCSVRTVYRWIEKNGLTTKGTPTAEYNPNLSLSENAKAMGLSIMQVRTIKAKMTK